MPISCPMSAYALLTRFVSQLWNLYPWRFSMIITAPGSQTLSGITVALALAVMAAPAWATDVKPKQSSVSAEAAAKKLGGMPDTSSWSAKVQHDRKPGMAWRTIGGTVKQIKGDTYMVEDYEGNQVQVYVGKETKHLRQKKVGDTVRAEITRGGFANSIQ